MYGMEWMESKKEVLLIYCEICMDGMRWDGSAWIDR